MSGRARWAVLGVLLMTLAASLVVAGQRPGQPVPPPLPGVERLGPDPGEPVATYLERAAASLPAPRAGAAWALVQLTGYRDAGAAARLGRGVRIARVVLRVPLPRVQTAQVTRVVAGQRPAAELAAAMRAAAAARAAAATQAAQPSRMAAVAAAEAGRLRNGCGCVLALLVRGDRAALQHLATRDGVRAVHAARVGTPPQGLALAPLLPEQREVAGPVPDDGPVPLR